MPPRPAADRHVVLEAEGQQHGLLDPLVDDPARRFLLRHAQAAGVEAGQHVGDGVAHFGAGASEGLMSARCSHAVSMMFWSCWVMIVVSFMNQVALRRGSGRTGRCGGCFQPFVDAGDQRHADAVAARIGAVRVARQVAAGQNRHIIFGVQAACELGVRQAGAAHVGPQVEAGVGQFDVHHLLAAAA
jgi:hypothetical protein